MVVPHCRLQLHVDCLSSVVAQRAIAGHDCPIETLEACRENAIQIRRNQRLFIAWLRGASCNLSTYYPRSSASAMRSQTQSFNTLFN